MDRGLRNALCISSLLCLCTLMVTLALLFATARQASADGVGDCCQCGEVENGYPTGLCSKGVYYSCDNPPTNLCCDYRWFHLESCCGGGSLPTCDPVERPRR